MKTRIGFVSNSSSSSFVVDKAKLTLEQIEAILDPRSFLEAHFVYAREFGEYDYPWRIQEFPRTIIGYTDMDNFDMLGFMEELGIPNEAFLARRDW